jgi:hypothetical protein
MIIGDNYIENNGIRLTEVESRHVRGLIEKHHYSHKCTPNHFASFDINNGLGGIQLGFGIRPSNKSSISKLINRENYCEFDRMWVDDELPKNSESQIISLLLKYLKTKYPKIKFVITYADGSVGNRGIIYQATNGIELKPIMADFYELENGERVHPVSMWHRHKTRAKAFLETEYQNIKHIKGTVKKPIHQYRYVYVLDKKLRKQFLKELGVKRLN